MLQNRIMNFMLMLESTYSLGNIWKFYQGGHQMQKELLIYTSDVIYFLACDGVNSLTKACGMQYKAEKFKFK